MAATTAASLSNPLRPSAGPQWDFLASEADIAIFGGAAGPGKTWALLVEPLRHVHNRRFGATLFRREMTRIMNQGGMWDEACELYLSVYPDVQPVKSPQHEIRFPSGATVQFRQLEHEQTKYSYNGAQIALIGFDQLEEFTEGQFWYMVSRNRTTCGVRAYVRATANPVPPEDPVGGWLATLIQWWWDPQTGYPIPERRGVVRWFVRGKDGLIWRSTKQEVIGAALAEGMPRSDIKPKSLTFIGALPEDNPHLPDEYGANLAALTLVDRERLAKGNWKIRPQAGLVFNRAWFPIVDAVPAEAVRLRAWDKAATPGAGDHSSGLGIAHHAGQFYVYDLVRGQWSYGERNRVMDQVASGDGKAVPIWVEQEPGSGGKESAEASIRQLAGYDVHAERATGSKLDRAKPVAAQAEVGNVKLVRGEWNEGFLQRLHNFTGAEGGKDDDVDALSLGFNKLAGMVSGGAQMGRAQPSPDKPPLEERMRARRERREKMMAGRERRMR